MQESLDRSIKDNVDNSSVTTKAGHALHEEAICALNSVQAPGDTQSNNKTACQAIANTPDGFSVIPSYVLSEIARRSGDLDLQKEANDAQDRESRERPFRPRVRSGDSHGAREVYDAHNGADLPGDLVRSEGQGPTTDDQANKIYDYTGMVKDFYKTVFNRDSIDDAGMKFISTENFRQDPNKAFNNAFWNGEQMIYGCPDAKSPFKTFMLLDVTGHEITHGVTESEANLKYYGQSGALNESLSDVFGELIKQYANHQTADKADWLVAAGIWKDGIQGRALRDMLHPGTAYDDPHIGKDKQPADMAHYVKLYGEKGDNGGVHINSGIPNRAFALFATAVGGYAWEDPGHIWYEARKHVGSDPSFAQFAYQTIEAAKSLGHTDEVDKLQKAWSTVGVVPSATAGDTLTPPAEGEVDYQLKQSGQLANENQDKKAA